MKNYKNLLLGLAIITIGMGSFYLNFITVFKKNDSVPTTLKEEILLPEEKKETLEQFIFPSEKQEPQQYAHLEVEGGDTPSAPLSSPGSSEPLISRPRNAPTHVSKKVTSKERENAPKKRPPKAKPAPVVEEKNGEKDVSTSASVDLAKPALVSEPAITASLTGRLIAYFDIEKILSWAANIITIVTGVLIILRRRKED
jgi:hypothetical protein